MTVEQHTTSFSSHSIELTRNVTIRIIGAFGIAFEINENGGGDREK